MEWETWFQVMRLGEQQFIVDLNRNGYSCEYWSLTWISCVHSIAALHNKGIDPHDKVDNLYNVGNYVKLYDNILMPINDKDMWPRADNVVLDPPLSFIQPGRPRKVRKRQLHEESRKRRIRRRI